MSASVEACTVALEVFVGVVVAVAVLVVADVDAFGDVVELALVVLAEGEGSVLGVGDCALLTVGLAVVEVLAVGVAVVEVLAVGLAVVLAVVVGVGVALGEEVADGNAWHCCAVPVDVTTVVVGLAAWAPGAGRENPATRTPPVTKPVTTGCTYAIRMKGPASAVRRYIGTNMPCCAVSPHWTPITMPCASPLLPTVCKRSCRNPDDLTIPTRSRSPATYAAVRVSAGFHTANSPLGG
ncbi:MAG TPA: hypothetical protein VF070_08670 [Streptosporangiaceae bacterium]